MYSISFIKHLYHTSFTSPTPSEHEHLWIGNKKQNEKGVKSKC